MLGEKERKNGFGVFPEISEREIISNCTQMRTGTDFGVVRVTCTTLWVLLAPESSSELDDAGMSRKDVEFRGKRVGECVEFCCVFILSIRIKMEVSSRKREVNPLERQPALMLLLSNLVFSIVTLQRLYACGLSISCIVQYQKTLINKYKTKHTCLVCVISKRPTSIYSFIHSPPAL